MSQTVKFGVFGGFFPFSNFASWKMQGTPFLNLTINEEENGIHFSVLFIILRHFLRILFQINCWYILLDIKRNGIHEFLFISCYTVL